MKKVLHRVLTVVFVGFLFLGFQAFGYSYAAQADETVQSPYGYYYKGTPDGGKPPTDNNLNDKTKNNNNNLVEKTKTNLKQAADSVSETLSSDQTTQSPYGYYYKGTPDGGKPATDNNINNDNKLVEKARTNLKETAENVSEKVSNVNGGNLIEKVKSNLEKTADNVREKLNLDEELPRSTKEFLNSTQERVEDTVKPITGTEKGYHQVR